MRIREISLKEAKDEGDDERQLDRLASSGTSDVSGLTFLQSSSNFGSEYHFQVSSTSSPPTSTILTAREDDETLRYGNLPPTSPLTTAATTVLPSKHKDRKRLIIFP